MAYRQTAGTRRRAEEKRDALLRAGTRLVATSGFGSAKVTAIARECDVSTGSLYSYFANHDELLAAVFDRAASHELKVVRQAVADSSEGPAGRLCELIRTFAGRAVRGRQMAWSLLFEPVSPAVEQQRLTFRRAYVEMGEEIIRDGIADGTFVEQSVPLVSSAVMGAIYQALIGRLTPGAEDDTELPDSRVISEIEGFCLRALSAPGHGHERT